MVSRVLSLVLGGAMAICTTTCTIKQEDIAGRWQAAGFYENGRQVPAKLDSIALSFFADGGYEFRSQGFYRESGSYRLSVRYLFLTDTTVQPPAEHVLKVLYVSGDSLKIRMNQKGNEQVLFFSRQK